MLSVSLPFRVGYLCQTCTIQYCIVLHKYEMQSVTWSVDDQQLESKLIAETWHHTSKTRAPRHEPLWSTSLNRTHHFYPPTHKISAETRSSITTIDLNKRHVWCFSCWHSTQIPVPRHLNASEQLAYRSLWVLLVSRLRSSYLLVFSSSHQLFIVAFWVSSALCMSSVPVIRDRIMRRPGNRWSICLSKIDWWTFASVSVS